MIASRAAAAFALLLLAQGCATRAKSFRPERVDTEPGWVAVRDVPLVRQTAPMNCGAAALSMVLGYWGAPMTIDEIGSALPASPGDGAIKAGDLRDIARARGMNAFVVAGELDDLRKQLEKKRPILVGVVDHGLPHYLVVVGYAAEKRRILVLDPAEGWRDDGVDEFMGTWESSGRVALIAFPAAASP